MSYFWRNPQHPEGYIPGAVRGLLPELTYPCWYNRVTSGTIAFEVPIGFILIIPPEPMYYPISALLLIVQHTSLFQKGNIPPSVCFDCQKVVHVGFKNVLSYLLFDSAAMTLEFNSYNYV